MCNKIQKDNSGKFAHLRKFNVKKGFLQKKTYGRGYAPTLLLGYIHASMAATLAFRVVSLRRMTRAGPKPYTLSNLAISAGKA